MKLPPEHQTHSRQTERGEIINRCDIFAQGVATFSAAFACLHNHEKKIIKKAWQITNIQAL